MRKRSDVAAAPKAPAEERTEPMFDEKPEVDSIPPREEKAPKPKAAPALQFVACPSCGLKQSLGVAGKTGGKCMRCDASLDGAAPEGAPAKEPAEAPATKPEPKSETRAKTVETNIVVERCPTCTKPLTVTALGNIPSCGCPTPGSKPAPVEAPAGQRGEAQSVMVTWGEEMYRVADFCNYRVGPFSAVVTPRPGETIARAAGRVMAELEEFASVERERKREAFVKALAKGAGK